MGSLALWIGFNEVVLVFVGAKMLAAPRKKINTALALGIVASVLGIAIFASVVTSWIKKRERVTRLKNREMYRQPQVETSQRDLIAELAIPNETRIRTAAESLFGLGITQSRGAIEEWGRDAEFQGILVRDYSRTGGATNGALRGTVGVAVMPETFSRIRGANGMPRLAEVPPDQDAEEFEIHLSVPGQPETNVRGCEVRLDILTTRQPGGGGAIAKFLAKFGEGIQQVEYEVSDVDRATRILTERFGVRAIYPATRAGANSTRINFFLVPVASGKKILIELVEHARPAH